MRDLEERAVGANIIIDLFEDFLMASSKKRVHWNDDLLRLCGMLRKQVEEWKAE